ncbi:MAG: DNA recombination protein RmuC [Gammaproteobacteria bacterium]|nr:DNA recombination protein RmuC [Gammaproteobacteria bacterium]MBT8105186.1 DNA recombination protein RmuC [Gammaproteobacteria bacterium]NNF50052.1 DNA recombination protein RmuC [Woeseiaceae bacterium]NNK25200.1 DNA recombination protein RmuC [Woeseiaceae bacterium]
MISLTIDPVYIEIGLPAAGIGLLVGVMITWLVMRRRRARVLVALEQAESDLKNQAALEEERTAAFELANAKLTQAFADISNRSLRANSDTFLRLARQNLETHQQKAKSELSEREKAVEALVKPIRDALDASQKQISELEKSRSEAYGSIRTHLEAMQISQKSLTKETQNLVTALRRPEVRGQWGEITLRRLVELAGMVEHCDFVEQMHVVGDEQNIRPDMIVNMPDQRQLVVDVKTPLDAYLAAAEADNDAQRKLGLERHAKNVRAHIRLLASKAYWKQFDESPEFVILFIPGDQFLSAALGEEPDLIEYALSQQIILATPTSFVALLKAVAYGWRQLALADNAKEIRILAEDLYGRLSTFVSHMNKVGRQLASSVENYNRAVGSLERSVLPGARKFTELGVHGKKDIDKLETLDPVPRTMVEGNDT